VESGQGGLSVDDELSVPCLNSGTTAEAR
jgi:hypothetical protein